MKELTELENAIATHKEYVSRAGKNVNDVQLHDAAQRLITRLKQCDYGDGVLKELHFVDAKGVHHRPKLYGVDWSGKSGKLYFVPEESET